MQNNKAQVQEQYNHYLFLYTWTSLHEGPNTLSIVSYAGMT